MSTIHPPTVAMALVMRERMNLLVPRTVLRQAPALGEPVDHVIPAGIPENAVLILWEPVNGTMQPATREEQALPVHIQTTGHFVFSGVTVQVTAEQIQVTPHIRIALAVRDLQKLQMEPVSASQAVQFQQV